MEGFRFLLLWAALLGALRPAEGLTEDNRNLYKFLRPRIIPELRSEGFVKDKCMIRLVKEAGNYLGSTYLFVGDGHRHEDLLRNFQIRFLHSYYTEPDSLPASDLPSYHLQIFDNKFTVDEVIRKRAPFQGTKFFLLVKDYQDAIEKFEVLWSYRIVDAVASYEENDTVYYYTYFPYCSKHCGEVGTPHLTAQCSISKGIFTRKEKPFPNKVKNLHRCPINVTFTENVPSSYYGASSNLEGWEVSLVSEIIRRLNGIPNYHVLSSKNTVYQTSTGYSRLLENSEVGGGLVVSLQGLVKTDFCMYGHSLCATWIVPRKLDSPLSFGFLIEVFPADVWLLVFLAYFVMSSTIRIFFKVSWQNVLFKLLPYLLGNTTRTRRTSKFLGALWLWFCLNINSGYQGGYQSLLLVPDSPQQLGSTKQVLESDLKILGVSDVVTDTIPYFKERYNITRRRLRMLDRRLSFEDLVYRLTVRKDSAFLGFRETVQYNVEGTEVADKIYIPQYCIIKYLLAFALKKNSHLTENFVRLANRLNENGFLRYFIRKYLSTESKLDLPKKVTTILKPLADSQKQRGPPPIDMNKMDVVFMCYLMGIAVSLAAFVLEILSKWNWGNIRRNIMREMESACPFVY